MLLILIRLIINKQDYLLRGGFFIGGFMRKLVYGVGINDLMYKVQDEIRCPLSPIKERLLGSVHTTPCGLVCSDGATMKKKGTSSLPTLAC